MTRLVLASASPRRRELLGLLDLPFTVVEPDVDERATASPARAKAVKVAQRGTATLAADTEIDLDGERLGKPRDAADAVAVLSRLAGRDHDVVTAVAVVDASGGSFAFAVRSRVTMRAQDDAAIAAYVATGEPLDKAGAYAIQGAGGALVLRSDGCRANIVGLPLCHAHAALRRAGVVTTERPEAVCQRHFAFTCAVWRTARAQGHALLSGQSHETALGPLAPRAAFRIPRPP
ncbi:MAG: septum formation protein Maf [Chloroflexi bacterium]|nr:septum formation protein Maf [Chloroflexota bacterium]